MTETPMYVTPITSVFPTFSDAREFFDKSGGMPFWGEDKKLGISDLSHGNRTLIVGEPGIGKTLLLERIKGFFDEQGIHNAVILLGQPKVSERIGSVLDSATPPAAILFDGLDEAQGSQFPEVLRQLEEISSNYPAVKLFITARWLFVNRYSASFSGYRLVAISPFTTRQVRDYLLDARIRDEDIDLVLHRLSFGHQFLVIQIPRYLSYFTAFLKEKGVTAATEVSRNQLFEYFIYRKLELEEKDASIRVLMKRVLEKLALSMEIYQTNVLPKDELMTFFDDLESDLKLTALSQIRFDRFFDRSLLKDNIESIQFDNTEFQEYLAAKEISRFSMPGRTAFAFSVDSETTEIYPTWFNALTFLVEMRNEILEQLIEFSGLRAQTFKIVDESFLTFLSRIDPRNLPQSLRLGLFQDVLAYHTRTLQWLRLELASALPDFFHPTLEQTLKNAVEEAELERDGRRYIPLGNALYIVGCLLERRTITLDRTYWRSKLMHYASNTTDNVVVQRHALFALGHLSDPSVIDDLAVGKREDDLVKRAFLQMCTDLDPDHPKSVELFIDAVKTGDYYGRYGLWKITRERSVLVFLRALAEDHLFAREFFDSVSSVRERDTELADHIAAVMDDKIAELAKRVILRSVDYNIANFAERSIVVKTLWKLLKQREPVRFVAEIVELIHKEHGHSGFFFATGVLAEVLTKEDVPIFLEKMLGIGEQHTAFSVLLTIKQKGDSTSDAIFESGRIALPSEYEYWDQQQLKPAVPSQTQTEGLLVEFRALLEPEPGKFSYSVFEFYNRHNKQLDSVITGQDRARLIKLVTEQVFTRLDPATFTLEMTESSAGSHTYTSSIAVPIFGDGLEVAKHLRLDVIAYRQKIIDYIPFASGTQLAAIFELLPTIKQEELANVIQLFTKRDSDVWRYRTSAFIDAVQQYHVTQASSILRELVAEPKCDPYARERALLVRASIMPDPDFLKEVFKRYTGSANGNELRLAELANGLLITAHQERNAIDWRLAEIVKRATAFITPNRAHSVSLIEEEVLGGNSFARPLMELKNPDHIASYLRLLEESMRIFAKGDNFHNYAAYMWKVVSEYFNTLKQQESYYPLRQLENKVAELKDLEGGNWLAGTMVAVRRSYLAYLGKPRNISEAIKKQNEAKTADVKKILNSQHLYQHLQEALETDLRRWIEGEGAYDVIIVRKKSAGRHEHEKLVQKTLKTQIENILLRRHFQVDVIREPQLLDEKRVDFIVRYGFAGPVVVEVKLTSNKDLQGRGIERSRSFISMQRYMDGYGSAYGIVLIINDTDAKNLRTIAESFQKIPRVTVQSFDLLAATKKSSQKGSAASAASPKARRNRKRPQLENKKTRKP